MPAVDITDAVGSTRMQLEMLKLTKSSSFKLIRHNSQGIKDKQKRRALSASKSEIKKENLLSF